MVLHPVRALQLHSGGVIRTTASSASALQPFRGQVPFPDIKMAAHHVDSVTPNREHP